MTEEIAGEALGGGALHAREANASPRGRPMPSRLGSSANRLDAAGSADREAARPATFGMVTVSLGANTAVAATTAAAISHNTSLFLPTLRLCYAC